MKTSAKLLVGLGVLILASPGYYFAFHYQNGSKRKVEEHVGHKNKIVNHHQLALLPVTESPLYLIGMGNGVRVADLGVEEPPIIEELISIGTEIDKSNAIGRSVPFGHFVLNDTFFDSGEGLTAHRRGEGLPEGPLPAIRLQDGYRQRDIRPW
jgi:hypothetical protein